MCRRLLSTATARVVLHNSFSEIPKLHERDCFLNFGIVPNTTIR